MRKREGKMGKGEKRGETGRKMWGKWRSVRREIKESEDKRGKCDPKTALRREK